MELIKYTEKDKTHWDNFVSESNNGTFLFKRDYMDYHKDRFRDMSLMLCKNGKLIGLFPVDVTLDGEARSHAGLTYGGLITKSTGVIEITEMLDEVVKCFNGMVSLIWKPVPTIYHKQPSDAEEIALASRGFHLVTKYASQVIRNLDNISSMKWRYIKKEIDIQYSSELDRLPEFWEILTKNLAHKHNTSPVHTAEEMKYLIEKFPEEILFVCAIKDGKVEAGSIIYQTTKLAHTQYLASTEMGRRCRMLDRLVYRYVSQTKNCLDFGISNERNGTLNEGLHTWKEGFGTETASYSMWRLDRPWR